MRYAVALILFVGAYACHSGTPIAQVQEELLVAGFACDSLITLAPSARDGVHTFTCSGIEGHGPGSLELVVRGGRVTRATAIFHTFRQLVNLKQEASQHP
jgi:hypothetical protein